MAVAASVIMDQAAALLNDFSKTIYTYAFQIPFLNIAQNELQETLEQNNVPISNEVSATLAVTTAMTDIGGATGPALPTNLIEIQGLYERETGTTNDFVLMKRCEFLPKTEVLTTYLMYWAWINQIIQFIGATSDRDVQINYVASRLPTIGSESDSIALINAQSFLVYRTAALAAEFLGENKSRADDLNIGAGLALDRSMAINTKGRQEMMVRRRPFRASYKVTGNIY